MPSKRGCQAWTTRHAPSLGAEVVSFSAMTGKSRSSSRQVMGCWCQSCGRQESPQRDPCPKLCFRLSVGLRLCQVSGPQERVRGLFCLQPKSVTTLSSRARLLRKCVPASSALRLVVVARLRRCSSRSRLRRHVRIVGSPLLRLTMTRALLAGPRPGPRQEASKVVPRVRGPLGGCVPAPGSVCYRAYLLGPPSKRRQLVGGARWLRVCVG